MCFVISCSFLLFVLIEAVFLLQYTDWFPTIFLNALFQIFACVISGFAIVYKPRALTMKRAVLSFLFYVLFFIVFGVIINGLLGAFPVLLKMLNLAEKPSTNPVDGMYPGLVFLASFIFGLIVEIVVLIILYIRRKSIKGTNQNNQRQS